MGIVFVRTQGLARLNPKTGESSKLAGGSIYPVVYLAYVIYILQGKQVTYTWDIMTPLLIYTNFMLSGSDNVEAEFHI